jgi:2-amino-4-hydroxy-6-hydroxymethyldihydropteridine diphosphokinase
MSEKRAIKGNQRQTRAYISLGSSHGDRVGFVQQAMQLLKDIVQIKVIECSSLYETQPLKEKHGQWFVNAVAAIETKLTALELLDVLKDIETRLGQIKDSHAASLSGSNSDRIIDLDILFFGDQIVETESLTIPHPKINKRAYALVPLLEIAPDFANPKTARTIAQTHEELAEPELVYLYGTREGL